MRTLAGIYELEVRVGNDTMDIEIPSALKKRVAISSNGWT